MFWGVAKFTCQRVTATTEKSKWIQQTVLQSLWVR